MIGFEPAAEAAFPPAAPQLTVVERMAETMRDMRAAGMVVTNDALCVYGDWSRADVERHGAAAADLARARATRQLDRQVA